MRWTGVDVVISELRQSLADNLWLGVVPQIYYGPINKNRDRDQNIIGEVYSVDREYTEVQFDDRYSVNVFFDPDDDVTNVNPTLQTTRDVGIVFAVDVKSIYPDLNYRPLEEIHRDVLQILNDRHSLQVVPNTIVSGLGAYGDLDTDKLLEYNMQPWHTFRINTTMNIAYDCSEPVASGATEYPFPIVLS